MQYNQIVNIFLVLSIQNETTVNPLKSEGGIPMHNDYRFHREKYVEVDVCFPPVARYRS